MVMIELKWLYSYKMVLYSNENTPFSKFVALKMSKCSVGNISLSPRPESSLVSQPQMISGLWVSTISSS